MCDDEAPSQITAAWISLCATLRIPMFSHQRLSVQETGSQNYRVDKLRLASIAVHLVVLAYVTFGWTVNSRSFLFWYLLVLPSIVLQWLLNFGSSIVSNAENLARAGCWDDGGNELQGAFLRTFLAKMGLVLSN